MADEYDYSGSEGSEIEDELEELQSEEGDIDADEPSEDVGGADFDPFWALDGDDDVDVFGVQQNEYAENRRLEDIEHASRRTKPFMSKYEFTKMIGVRAEQIMFGAQVLVDMEEFRRVHRMASADIDPFRVALYELEKGVLPFMIRRRIVTKHGTNGYETWRLEEFKNIESLISYYSF